MSSERHEGYYGDHYHPAGPRPDYGPSQRSEGHYGGQQLPRASHRVPWEHQHARQDSHWDREARVPQEGAQRHPTSHEWRGEEDRRRLDPRGHGGGREEARRAQDEAHTRPSGRYPLDREWEAEQRHGNQGYRRRGTEPAIQKHISAQNAGRAMHNGRSRSLDRMDGRQRVDLEDGNTGVRQEYPGPGTEYSRGYANYALANHDQAWGAQYGNTRPHTYPYQGQQASQFESQWPESQWEADIHNMLPSQVDMAKGTLRFRGTMRNRRASHVGPVVHAWDQQQDEDEPKTEAEVLEALNSLRDQPWQLQLRRETKNELKAKLPEGRWYSRGPVTKAVRKGGSSLAKLFQANYIWHNVLKRIEGRFGSSVVAVFNFLRAMIQLNLLLGLVLCGGVVLPAALLAADDGLQSYGWLATRNGTLLGNDDDHDACLYSLQQHPQVESCNADYTTNLTEIVEEHSDNVVELVQDVLQGTGFLEWTILFAGRFPASAGEDSHYEMGLAYILSVIVALLISLIFVVYFVAKFFRQMHARANDTSMQFPKIVFTGWDYTVREKAAAETMQICIIGEVKTAFDDDQFLERKKRRTKKQQVTLLLIRATINVVILALIGAGWTGIYFLVDVAQKKLEDGEATRQFLWEYAPTVVVSVFNFVYPLLFSIVVSYEQYRGHTELLITLIRCVLVRLTSLIVLMSTKIIVISEESRGCNPTDPCWETRLGQQIYSVILLDMLIHFGLALVVDVLRKSLRHFKNSLCQTLGRIEFFVPTHVLDIVYLQSACWLSVIFAPILTIVVSLCFFLLFGLKLFTVTYTCVPATRVFRASRSSAMFMTILCLAFLLCLVPNGLALLYLRPSLACSPFRGLDYGWQMFTHYVCGLTSASTSWIRWLVFAVDEALVVMLVFLAAVLLLAYYSCLIVASRGWRKNLSTQPRTRLFSYQSTPQHSLCLREPRTG